MPPVKVPAASAGKWCTADAPETGSPKKRQQKVQWQRPVETRNDLQGRTWQNSMQNKNQSTKTCTKTTVGAQHNMAATKEVNHEGQNRHWSETNAIFSSSRVWQFFQDKIKDIMLFCSQQKGCPTFIEMDRSFQVLTRYPKECLCQAWEN